MHYCNTARLFKGKEAKAYSFLFFSSSLFSSTKTISSGPRTVSTTQVGFSSTFFHANGELVRAELNLRVIVPFRKDFYNFPKQCPSILENLQKLLIRKLFRIHFLSTLFMNILSNFKLRLKTWFLWDPSKNIWKVSKLWQFGRLHSSKLMKNTYKCHQKMHFSTQCR